MSASKQSSLWAPLSAYYNLVDSFLAAAVTATEVYLSFASVPNPGADAQFQALTLHPSLAEMFQRIAAARLNDLRERVEDGDVVVREYAAGARPREHEIEHLDLRQHARVQDQLAPLAAPLLMPPFTDAKSFKSVLRYYVITLQPPTGALVHCFRYYSDTFELDRKWSLALRGPGYYNHVRTPGFLFDHAVDCFIRGDDMLIVGKDKFQRIFQFYEYVRQDAKRVIRVIEPRVPIANRDALITGCERDPRLAVKVAELAGQPHLRRLSIPRIRRMIERYGLQVKIVEHEGREMLEYSGAHRWQFIHLLSDEYLSSPMTALDYEVNSKRPTGTGTRSQNGGAKLQLVPPGNDS